MSLHIGLTSAIIDETLGGLNYIMKREGVIDSGPSFTVHLEVDYKKPIPSESTLICTASVTSIEGRKAWVAATVLVETPTHFLLNTVGPRAILRLLGFCSSLHFASCQIIS